MGSSTLTEWLKRHVSDTFCDGLASPKLLTAATEQFQKIEQQHFNG